jgi:hypothetical protein
MTKGCLNFQPLRAFVVVFRGPRLRGDDEEAIGVDEEAIGVGEEAIGVVGLL